MFPIMLDLADEYRKPGHAGWTQITLPTERRSGLSLTKNQRERLTLTQSSETTASSDTVVNSPG